MNTTETTQKTQTVAQIQGENAARKASDRLMALITELIAPMGYDLVHIEILNQRQKILRVYIDWLDTKTSESQGIGIQDCVQVTKALDLPLENSPEIEAIFKGTYELEVSSPGVDRPLRQAKDFTRFQGREARLHTYRPLSGAELQNDEYAIKNPRQKNFLGTLAGFESDSVLLALSNGTPGAPSKGKKAKKNSVEGSQNTTVIRLPLPLISKANLEPRFDFESTESDPIVLDERE